MTIMLEAIRHGYDGGGLACGPVEGSYNAEAKVMVTDDKGKKHTRYIVLSQFTEFFNLYDTGRSLYDKLMTLDESIVGKERAGVTGERELRNRIARMKFKKVYELLYAIIEFDRDEHEPTNIPEMPIDLDAVTTEPIPVAEEEYYP